MFRKGIKIIDFIIFSNLFIALCAVLMCLYSTDFFKLPPPSTSFLGFIFFSTMSSYSIHWYLTNAAIEKTASRTLWLLQYKKIHALFFIISVIGASFFLLSEINILVWILPAIFLTVLYTAPKFPFLFFHRLQKFIIGKTFLLAAMWTYVTTALPLLAANIHWFTPQFIFLLNRFFLIFSICILFDIRDKKFDKNTGVKSLVTLLTPNKIKIIFYLICVFNFISGIVLFFYNQDIKQFIILSLPVVFTISFYPLAIKSRNDYLFYFILDGLMALSPILWIIDRIIIFNIK